MNKIPILLPWGFANCLMSIGFGKWVQSKGYDVEWYIYQLAHGKRILDYFDEFGIDNVKEVKHVNGRRIVNRDNCLDYLKTQDKPVFTGFYPDCLTLLGWDHPSTDNSIAIHIRRGDYLNPDIINGFAGNLCETRYFNNIAEKCKGINLPIKIFSDHLEQVPDKIKDLFPTAEFISKDTISDFNAISACKVIFTYNSTFSKAAAWLNTDATVYYPACSYGRMEIRGGWRGLSIR